MAATVTGSTNRTSNSWIVWAFWMAGAALLFAEGQSSLAFVEAGLRHNMGNLLGWGPALGMVTLRIVAHSLWHWTTFTFALQALPVMVLGVLLLILGLALHNKNRRTMHAPGK